MNIYHINSLVKTVIGIAILISVYQFLNPFVDPTSAVIISAVGLILVVWGAGFYIFLLGMSWVSDKKYRYLAPYAYKISFITGVYATLNRMLIGFGIRGWWIGIGLTIVMLVIAGAMLGLIKPLEVQTDEVAMNTELNEE